MVLACICTEKVSCVVSMRSESQIRGVEVLACPACGVQVPVQFLCSIAARPRRVVPNELWERSSVMFI